MFPSPPFLVPPLLSNRLPSTCVTYLEFHLLFNLPAIILLGWMARKRLRAEHLRWIAAVLGIVVAFTYPWDSWAVGEGIWGFGEDRVLFRVGNLPIEEIGFFVLETIVVALLVVMFLGGARQSGAGEKK